MGDIYFALSQRKGKVECEREIPFLARSKSGAHVRNTQNIWRQIAKAKGKWGRGEILDKERHSIVKRPLAPLLACIKGSNGGRLISMQEDNESHIFFMHPLSKENFETETKYRNYLADVS